MINKILSLYLYFKIEDENEVMFSKRIIDAIKESGNGLSVSTENDICTDMKIVRINCMIEDQSKAS